MILLWKGTSAYFAPFWGGKGGNAPFIRRPWYRDRHPDTGKWSSFGTFVQAHQE